MKTDNRMSTLFSLTGLTFCDMMTAFLEAQNGETEMANTTKCGNLFPGFVVFVLGLVLHVVIWAPTANGQVYCTDIGTEDCNKCLNESDNLGMLSC